MACSLLEPPPCGTSMSARSISLGMVCGLVFAAPACGQVVQLPTFHFFSVSTSVSVPDSGGAYLGGIDRSSLSSRQFQLPLLPGQSARDFVQSTQGMSVRATVHDLQRPQMESTQAPENPAERFRTRLAAASREQVPRAASTRRAEIERDEQEAVQFLAQGDRARDAGKPQVARVYYTMAARRAQGELAQRIADRLAALNESAHATAGP